MTVLVKSTRANTTAPPPDNPYITQLSIISMKHKPSRLPAGRYYIGDPGRILKRSDFHEWVDRDTPKELEMRGHTVVVLSPGIEGGYECSRSGRDLELIGVDSGSVAAIPAALAREAPGDWINVVEFEGAFTCWRHWYTMFFGDVKVWLP